MKTIKFGEDARKSIGRGVDFAVKCVALSHGPGGRNATIGRHGLPPEDTNDGVTIAMNIELPDETEQLGVMKVRRVTLNADIKGGDGTTTAAVLYGAIKKTVFSLLENSGAIGSKKINTSKIAKEIRETHEKVTAELKEIARPIKTEEIYDVAMVSAEHEWIAKILSDIYSKIGKDGYVSIEDGSQTAYDIYRGIEIPNGFHSDYFINNESKRQCVIEKPNILVTNQRLDSTAMVQFIEKLVSEKINNLIMIAPDFDKEFLSKLNATKIEQPETNYVAIKYPTYDKDDILKDIASLSGAKFLDRNTYPSWDDFIQDIKVDNIGKFDQAILTAGNSVLLGGDGDVTERVEILRKQISETLSVFDKNKLEQRLAFMAGGVAVVRIDVDMDGSKYFRKKMEDAVNTVQFALKNGVVRGGGLALKEVSEKLPKNILTDALKRPYDQINENIGEVLPVPENINDALDVVQSSLKSACDEAVTLVMTELSIAIKEEPKEINHDNS